jgi:CRISPR-associated protein Cas5d
VKAIFESILWGPAVEILPRRVEICAPVQYHSYTTNYGGPLREDRSRKKGNNYQLLATVLVDVCYKLYAEVHPNPRKMGISKSASAWDAKTSSPGHAYQDIFDRRLKRGQSYSIPALGWREFTPSYFGPLRDETKVLSSLSDIVVPSMLRMVFGSGYNSSVSYVYDQDVVIEAGCLKYPDRSRRDAE